MTDPEGAERPGRGATTAVVLLCGLVLLTRLVFALADPRDAVAADVIQDDAFYYLQIARNVREGRGPSFDGEHATNAFHPLYLASLLPLVGSADLDPWQPVRSASFLGVLVALATAPFVYAVGRMLGGTGAGLVALALFAASPRYATLGVNGQETGLALLFGTILVWLTLRGPGLEPNLSPARAWPLGLAAALGVLARVDVALLVLAIGVDWVRRARRDDALRAALPGVLVAVGTAALVWGVWGVTSYGLTGAWLPTSGAASRQIAFELGWSNLPPLFGPAGVTFFDATAPPAAWVADVAAKLVVVYLHEHPLLAPLRFDHAFSIWPALGDHPLRRLLAAVAGGSGAAGALVVAALLTGIAALALVRLRRRGIGTSPLGSVIPLYTLFAAFGYTILSPSHWYFPRYLALPLLLGTLAVLGQIGRAVSRRQQSSRVLAVGLVGLGIALPLWHLSQLWTFAEREVWLRQSAPKGFYASWEALGPQLPEAAQLGAFQAGIYGWFAGRDVLNLDGKVNSDAQRALAGGRALAYIADSGVDYVIDQPGMVKALALRHASPAERRILVPVAREKRRGGATLYRVDRVGVDRVAGPAETEGTGGTGRPGTSDAPSVEHEP